MPNPKEKLTNHSPPFAYRVLIGASIVIGLLLLLFLFWHAVQVLLLAFAGILLAILLRSPSDWLAERARISPHWAIMIVLAVLLTVLTGAGLLLVPQIGQQVQDLQDQLPQAVRQAQQWLGQYEWGRWIMEVFLPLQQENNSGMFLGEAIGAAYTTVQVVLGVFILLFTALYLAVNPGLYISGVLRLVPIARRKRAAEVLKAVGNTLRWWLYGSFIRMAAVGVMTFVGLWLLDIPLAFLLAALAFFLDFIPYFGPIIAAVPAVLLGFMEGPQEALYVVILYVVVQQVESLLISPIVYQRTIYMPPVLTVLAQILLFSIVGTLGIVLATPLVAAVLVLVKMLYVEQLLGDYQNKKVKGGT